MNTGADGSTEPLKTRPGNVSSGTGQKSTSNGGDGIVEQAQQKVGEVASQVQEKAGEMVEQVRRTASTRLDQQKDQATGSLWSVANAIRRTGEELRDKDQGAIAQVTDKAAEQVERLSSFLGHRDVNQIVNEVQHFARRQPGLFLGGAFALGLLGARFLKSSSQSSQSSELDYSGQAYRVSGEGAGNYGYGYDYDRNRQAGSGMGMGASSDYGYGQQSGDWSGDGQGTTAGGYSTSISAPPIRGVDPRISGGTGEYSTGYGQGYEQGYAGQSGATMEGTTGTEYNGTAPYQQDTEA